MLAGRRRDLLLGALAGVIGAVVFGWAMYSQDSLPTPVGGATPLGLIVTLVVLTLLGAGFGVVVGYQPRAVAATTSGGVLLGLLWWIVGPLTLASVLRGQAPTWSLADASAAFSSLVGLLLYG